ncbi:Sigma-adaptin 3A [Naganishia albida]|nr:Sigma-adaptin 3A [Naganishia albida]
MIQAVLIFNNHGKPRLSKFYTPVTSAEQSALLGQIFQLVSDRPAGLCNFLDAPGLVFPGRGRRTAGKGKGKSNALKRVEGDEEEEESEDDELRVIYRHYATLYFVFVVDGAESELGILDLIQVFVESLDRSFENVCELDLIFHFDEVILVLSEIIQGGLVLETNIGEISTRYHEAAAQRKASASSVKEILPSSLASIAADTANGIRRGGPPGGGRMGVSTGDNVRNVAGRWLQGLGFGG